MTLDQFQDVLVILIGVILTVAAILALTRLTLGPSVLDRVVAADVIISVVICALGTYAALTQAWTTLPLLVSLTLIGFLGAVAVARFVARDRDTPFVARRPDRLEDQEIDLAARRQEIRSRARTARDRRPGTEGRRYPPQRPGGPR